MGNMLLDYNKTVKGYSTSNRLLFPESSAQPVKTAAECLLWPKRIFLTFLKISDHVILALVLTLHFSIRKTMSQIRP